MTIFSCECGNTLQMQDNDISCVCQRCFLSYERGIKKKELKSKNLYKHCKTGNVYEVLDDNALNVTNGFEEQRCVLYTRNDIKTKTFVREYDEFMEKFKKI